MTHEAQRDDSIPTARPIETAQPRSLRDRWEKARPQVILTLRRVADVFNRLADQLE